MTNALIDTKLRTDKKDAWIRLGVFSGIAVFILTFLYLVFETNNNSRIQIEALVVLIATLIVVFWRTAFQVIFVPIGVTIWVFPRLRHILRNLAAHLRKPFQRGPQAEGQQDAARQEAEQETKQETKQL